MALDPNTFGGSRAAEVLVEKLTKINDPRLTKKVGAFLHYTNTGFAKLAAVDDDEWFARLIVVFREAQLAKVNFHDDVNTYVRNLVTAASKDWMRGEPV
jgi:hypothetical protein